MQEDYRTCANNADIVRVRLQRVKSNVCAQPSVVILVNAEKALTLSDQKTYTDTRQVEPVKPTLNIEVDVLGVAAAFPLQDTLCDGSHSWVVSLLDHFECFCKLPVIVTDFWWPSNSRRVRKVSSPNEPRHHILPMQRSRRHTCAPWVFASSEAYRCRCRGCCHYR